jgi:uncharacterized protein YeaO (DUF488 family)
MLKTRPIKDPKRADDGLRISVMSRHTLSDGITPDRKISTFMYDQWWRKLGPPSRLISDYDNGLPWEEYEKRYIQYLRTQKQLLTTLMQLARDADVTILCVEDSPLHCHRRLIAEVCKMLDDQLIINVE